MEIWTGERKSTSKKDGGKILYSITSANNFGLILILYGINKSAVLCGDCDYNVMPETIKNKKFDYVVVSHHGSKMDTFPFHSDDGIAIISYGIANNYGHTDSSKMKEYDKNGYCIETTVGKKYINIDLS